MALRIAADEVVERSAAGYPAFMPGYVAIAFLESSMVRLDRPGLAEPRLPAPDAAASAPIEDLRVIRSITSEQVRAQGAALRERRAGLRRAWEQMTFYLFDAESWR